MHDCTDVNLWMCVSGPAREQIIFRFLPNKLQGGKKALRGVGVQMDNDAEVRLNAASAVWALVYESARSSPTVGGGGMEWWPWQKQNGQRRSDCGLT